MGRSKSLIWLALAAGLALSVLLFSLLHISPSHSGLLSNLQWPGFAVCWLQPGSIEPATTMEYELIGLPINGIVYAAIIYILLGLVRRAKLIART
jgi:membrane protease YdiL (CAAX protease family)